MASIAPASTTIPTTPATGAAPAAAAVVPETVPGPPTIAAVAGPPAPAGLGMRWDAPPAMALKPGMSYRANIATPDGVLGVQLLAGAAPLAVNSTKFLADNGFYKGSPSHRKITDFMFQFGDPTGTGTGGPGYQLKQDPVPEGWKYHKGVVAMANSGPDTDGSQMFVMTGAALDMPPLYTIIGYVDEGREVLDKINAREVGPSDANPAEQSKPVEPFWIDDITVTETPIAPKE